MRHLGFGNLVGKHTDNGHALLVDGQHDLDRLRMGDAEKAFQNMHDELHRGVVVIQQQHLVKRRTLRLRLGLGQHIGTVPGLGGLGHRCQRVQNHYAFRVGSHWGRVDPSI